MIMFNRIFVFDERYQACILRLKEKMQAGYETMHVWNRARK